MARYTEHMDVNAGTINANAGLLLTLHTTIIGNVAPAQQAWAIVTRNWRGMLSDEVNRAPEPVLKDVKESAAAAIWSGSLQGRWATFVTQWQAKVTALNNKVTAAEGGTYGANLQDIPAGAENTKTLQIDTHNTRAVATARTLFLNGCDDDWKTLKQSWESKETEISGCYTQGPTASNVQLIAGDLPAAAAAYWDQVPIDTKGMPLPAAAYASMKWDGKGTFKDFLMKNKAFKQWYTGRGADGQDAGKSHKYLDGGELGLAALMKDFDRRGVGAWGKSVQKSKSSGLLFTPKNFGVSYDPKTGKTHVYDPRGRNAMINAIDPTNDKSGPNDSAAKKAVKSTSLNFWDSGNIELLNLGYNPTKSGSGNAGPGEYTYNLAFQAGLKVDANGNIGIKDGNFVANGHVGVTLVSAEAGGTYKVGPATMAASVKGQVGATGDAQLAIGKNGVHVGVDGTLGASAEGNASVEVGGVKTGVKAEVIAGLSFKADLDAGYHDGKFKLGGKIGGAFGIGGSIAPSIEIDVPKVVDTAKDVAKNIGGALNPFD